MADRFFWFGTGNAFLTPNSANPTPQEVIDLQNIEVSFKGDTIKVHGAKKFPLETFDGKSEITGKATMAAVNTALMSSIFAGSTLVTGSSIGIVDESTGTISGATYTAANTTGFADRGVKDENGQRLICVASAPAAGQYTVTTAGVYTFNSVATGKTYKIAYVYTSSSTGRTIKYNNQLMGGGIKYTLDLYNTLADGSKVGLKLFAVKIPTFGLSFANDKAAAPEIDFDAMEDSSGRVFEFYVP